MECIKDYQNKESRQQLNRVRHARRTETDEGYRQAKHFPTPVSLETAEKIVALGDKENISKFDIFLTGSGSATIKR